MMILLLHCNLHTITNLKLTTFPVLLEACHNDASCLSDRAGLEAITQLHRQLDDDANGNVDLSESDDVSKATYFIIELNLFFRLCLLYVLRLVQILDFFKAKLLL